LGRSVLFCLQGEEMKLLFAVIYIFLITTIYVSISSKAEERTAIHKIQLNSKSHRIESIHMRDDGKFIYLNGSISKEFGRDFSNYLIKAVCTDQNDKIIDKESARVTGSPSLLRKRTTASFDMRVKDHLEIAKCDISVTD
jgi:hypothetical protein